MAKAKEGQGQGAVGREGAGVESSHGRLLHVLADSLCKSDVVAEVEGSHGRLLNVLAGFLCKLGVVADAADHETGKLVHQSCRLHFHTEGIKLIS